MSSYICTTCRASLQKATRLQKHIPVTTLRTYSSDPTPHETTPPHVKISRKKSKAPSFRKIYGGDSTTPDNSVQPIKSQTPPQTPISKKAPKLLDIAALLSKPSWSVRSLLLTTTSPTTETEITPQKLHHLLRLSALPLPRTPKEEEKMLETLHSQLHFVRDIQKVDTDGVEPMYGVRDESEEGIKGATIGMADLKEAFDNEEIKGRNRRPRRKREEVGRVKEEEWDAFAPAGRTVEAAGGRYFVVRSGKE